MTRSKMTFTFSMLCMTALTLTPFMAAADCINTSSTIDGAINGAGTFTSEQGYQIAVEQAEYTPHGDNALGFVLAEMQAAECLGATEGFALKSAALRMTITGDQPVGSVSISYCTSYPILNISAGTESPAFYHENWKRHPLPSEIPDDSGAMVQLTNDPVWNGDTYMDEAKITLTAETGMTTLLFGLREGFVTEVCVN